MTVQFSVECKCLFAITSYSSVLTICTGLDIKVQRLMFLKMIGNLLVTSSLNLTAVGKPDLVKGPTGGLAVVLDGVKQYLDLGALAGQCATDTELCKHGLTISFRLKFLRLAEGDVVFSSGADGPAGYGVAMFYRHGRLYLRVSTITKEWTVTVSQVSLNKFIDIKFSWSVQTGLKLLFNGEVVAETTKFIRRSVTGSLVGKFYIGKSVVNSMFAKIIMEGWNIVYGSDDIIKILKLITGGWLQ